ncbi:putative T7SS-secreted protein [Streptomyces sp. CB00455]|uniref:putative T7SS-secreted protein n=1 Tax=Streptomyces sp. CB00455 TaxID=1703927 RepID=UPI003FD5C158
MPSTTRSRPCTAWRWTADRAGARYRGRSAQHTWSQQQAQQAIDLYRKAVKAVKDAHAAYVAKADVYKAAAKAGIDPGSRKNAEPACSMSRFRRPFRRPGPPGPGGRRQCGPRWRCPRLGGSKSR